MTETAPKWTEMNRTAAKRAATMGAKGITHKTRPNVAEVELMTFQADRLDIQILPYDPIQFR